MSRSRQTVIFVIGVALAIAVWLWQLGQRPWVMLLGIGLGVVCIGLWFAQLRGTPVAPSDDLLEAFEANVGVIPPHSDRRWHDAVAIARSGHSAAVAISQTDSFYTGDSVVALHNIVALLERLSQGLHALEQVETPTYREMVHQYLTTSETRLRDTCEQLQILRDQLMVAGLGNTTATPANLTAAIAANQEALQQSFPSL